MDFSYELSWKAPDNPDTLLQCQISTKLCKPSRYRRFLTGLIRSSASSHHT